MTAGKFECRELEKLRLFKAIIAFNYVEAHE